MEDFLHATAWTMTEPQPYGLFHIVILLGGIPLSVMLAWKLRKVNERCYHRILFVIAVILLLSELYKQLFHFYVMDNKAYDWWIFPFQLCSLPMYLSQHISPHHRQGILEEIQCWITPLLFS